MRCSVQGGRAEAGSSLTRTGRLGTRALKKLRTLATLHLVALKTPESVCVTAGLTFEVLAGRGRQGQVLFTKVSTFLDAEASRIGMNPPHGGHQISVKPG